jgi:hypothetical protein
MTPPFKTTLTWHENHVSQSVVHDSPTPKPSAQGVFEEITRSIPQISDYTEIVYWSLSPDDAESIHRSLDTHAEVERNCIRYAMPLQIHTKHDLLILSMMQ